MTLEEQQEYLILEKMLPTKGSNLLLHQYFNLTESISGDSGSFIKDNLIKKGYLQEGNFINPELPLTLHITSRTEIKIFITDIGEKAYYSLRKKKRNELIQKIAFWILFVASVVSAIYAVLTYYADASTKNQKSQTPTLMTEPIKTDTSKKSMQTVQLDTTNQKKNVSYKIDTTKKK